MAELKKDYTAYSVRLVDGEDVIDELRIDDLSEEIVKKLAVYGAFVKLQRSTAGKDPEEHEDIISKTMQALREGKWSTGQRIMSKKQVLLQMIRDTQPNIRAQFVQALKASGQLERAGVTEEEIQEALKG